MVVPIRIDPIAGTYDYDEFFSWYQLVGLILLFIGVIIYNELVAFPFWGFDRYTKEAIAKRKAEDESRRRCLINEDKDANASVDIDY
jgi:hypothetical protein